jgi:hypothetical protein
MDEVSSYVRLKLPLPRRQGRAKDCSTSSSNPMMEGLGAESEEKREPVSDIDSGVADMGAVPAAPADVKASARNGYRLPQR